MKKLTGISLIIMMMIFLGIISVAEARTGSTSDSSSSSKSRSTTSKTTTSRPSKTTSATDSIFANTAKNNEAKNAWQKINKKPVDNTPVVVAPVSPPVQNDNTNQQLADIQRQLAENRRQQQIADAARIAAELVSRNNNNRPQPVYVTPSTVTTPPVANVTNAVTDSIPAKSGGTSWFMIFLIIGGIVVIYFWLKNRNSSNTIYRL
jgi:flagellar basal body-associated protein FliL